MTITRPFTDGGTSEDQAEYAAAAARHELAGYDYTDAEHERFLEDKDAISGLDLEPEVAVAHIAPTADRPALCLEGTGVHLPRAAVLATWSPPACPECLAIAERLDALSYLDLARLAAGAPRDAGVVSINRSIDTEVLRVREISTQEVTGVRLFADHGAPTSAIKADLWQEIRLERPMVYAPLCAGDLTAAYAAT